MENHKILSFRIQNGIFSSSLHRHRHRRRHRHHHRRHLHNHRLRNRRVSL